MLAGTDPEGVDGVASHPPCMALQPLRFALLNNAKYY